MRSQPTPTVQQTLPKLTLQHLWPLNVLAGIFFFVSTHPIRPHDFWWHLKAGQEIVTAGRIPNTDTFSYTMAGTPYENYAAYWLMEVAYYFLYATGGAATVVFFQALLVTTAYGLLLWLCRLVSRSWRVAAIATLFAAALGFDNWNVRPQALAFPAGVIILTVIYVYRARPRRWLLALPPAVMLIWANSHGSFLIGLIMLGVWLADDTLTVVLDRFTGQKRWRIARLWPLALTLLAACIACLVNPRGVGIVAYVTNLSGNSIIRGIVPEWAPPTFADWTGTLFLIGLLLCAVMLAASPRRPSRFQLMIYVVFGALALSTSRSVVWFGIVMAPVLADHLGALAGRWAPVDPARPAQPGKPALNYLFAAIVLLGVIAGLPWFKHILPLPPLKAGLVSRETPMAATEVLLRQQLPGRLFHDLGFGSYLIWAAQPAYPVFVRSALELYPAPIWRDYLDISAARDGWEGRLARYGVNTLMLSPTEQPALVSAARASPHWRLFYEDEACVIFVHVDAP